MKDFEFSGLNSIKTPDKGENIKQAKRANAYSDQKKRNELSNFNTGQPNNPL